jgi:2-oxoglutarate dehydrogenase E2 component (dihydrolipoamide succinyltransferase)
MLIDIVVPELGESITEGTITTWLVQVGDAVSEDQPLLELETEKVTAELPAPKAGVLTEILVGDGEDVPVGAVVGRIEPGATASAAAESTASPASEPSEGGPTAAPAASGKLPLSPAVRRLVEEHGLDPSQIPATGREGRILKADVLDFMKLDPATGVQFDTKTEPKMDAVGFDSGLSPDPFAPASARSSGASVGGTAAAMDSNGRGTRRVKMTRLRRAIARRLKEVQNNAAMLTTFNEVDMKPVMDLRARYKDRFVDRHGVKLGFMGFFVKAAVEALKRYPAINGAVDGDHIIYNDFFDVGVAVSSKRGLVVPVIRDADRLSFAEVEQEIRTLAGSARDGKLSLEQLSGGTFTITNGGVFGSMLSTPIINGSQSAILGMHNIVKRPVAVGDSVEVRPVMYLALSYDHRIVDGSEAVQFLVTIKDIIEDPARLLLEV